MDKGMDTAVMALQRQRLLLEIEYNCEKEAYRRQTETMGLQRKVKRGDAWWPLKVGRSYYNSLNQLSLEVMRTTDCDIEHNFEFGRPVWWWCCPIACNPRNCRRPNSWAYSCFSTKRPTD